MESKGSEFRQLDKDLLAKAAPHLLFYVQIQNEAMVLVYEYVRQGNDVGVNMFWLDYDNLLGPRHPVGPTGQLVFGARIGPDPDDSAKKCMIVTAIPEKRLTLELKEKRVKPKVILQKKRCVPTRVLVYVTQSVTPDISKIVIEGVHHKKTGDVQCTETIVPSKQTKDNFRKQIIGI